MKYKLLPNFDQQSMCYTSCIAMVFYYQKLNNFVKKSYEVTNIGTNLEGWHYASFPKLAKMNYEVIYYDDYDYNRLLNDPFEEFSKIYGLEEAKRIDKRTPLNLLSGIIDQCLSSNKINFVQKSPTQNDLEYCLNNDFHCIPIVNYWKFYKKNVDDARTHAVLVDKLLKNEVIIADPGPPATQNMRLSLDFLFEAMNLSSEGSANLLALRKCP